jgi:hypothetical protein
MDALVEKTNVFTKINLSMVSLKTGDVLSTLIPGSLGLYAIAPHIPFLAVLFADLNKASAVTGIALLIGAVFIGGILEALTRIGWEKLFLVRREKPPNILSNLKTDPHALEIYERTVQSSYKYVTFYANLAWAIGMLVFGRINEAIYPALDGLCSIPWNNWATLCIVPAMDLLCRRIN